MVSESQEKLRVVYVGNWNVSELEKIRMRWIKFYTDTSYEKLENISKMLKSFCEVKKLKKQEITCLIIHPGRRNDKTKYIELLKDYGLNNNPKIIFGSNWAAWKTITDIMKYLEKLPKYIENNEKYTKEFVKDILDGLFYWEMLELSDERNDIVVKVEGEKVKLEENEVTPGTISIRDDEGGVEVNINIDKDAIEKIKKAYKEVKEKKTRRIEIARLLIEYSLYKWYIKDKEKGEEIKNEISKNLEELFGESENNEKLGLWNEVSGAENYDREKCRNLVKVLMEDG